MAKRDYDNWLISLEADNFSSFIKVWFAYLATVHEIILRSVNAEEKKQLLKEMRGDSYFLKKYKESHLHHINISESTKLSIIECYRTSKSHIQKIYPEYYFVTYYKKIEDNVLYTDIQSVIEQNEFVFKVRIEKDHLYIGILFEGDAPINTLLKKRYIDTKIPLIPDVKAIEILDSKLENCIFVGDSDVDIMTSSNAEIPCISVLWGYRDKEFLISKGAKHIAETTKDIEKILYLS